MDIRKAESLDNVQTTTNSEKSNILISEVFLQRWNANPSWQSI